VKKIIIITYYWPPAAGPGVQRFLKIAKYLPQFGWKPYVITVKDGTYSSTDESLANDIPKEVEVFKTKTKEPFKIYEKLTGNKGGSKTVGMINMNPSKSPIKKLSLYIRANCFIPDPRKGWVKYAVKQASELIEKEGIDTVITTSPPHSTHLIGLKLKKKYGIHWIADFRDPWTNLYFNKMLPRSKRTIRKDRKLETEVVKNADFLTVVSNGLKEEFIDRNKNIEIIYNGFDEDDIPETQSLTKEQNFTLSYVGNFKPNQNIESVWQAISELSNENSDFKKHFRISFTGNTDDGVHEYIKKHHLSDNVVFKGYVKHHEATEIMSASDMLLFVIPNATNNHLIITGKLFEYLATQNPMLSVGPVNGNAAAIIEEAQRDKIIDYNDIENIKTLLLTSFNRWQSGNTKFKHDKGNLEAYSRKELTRKLAKKLNEFDGN